MNGAVLVTYGSWCGSTAEVAEEIGKVLREGGWEVDVLPAKQAQSVDRYQAVVVGTAIRMGRCRGDALKFVTRNKAALDRVPAVSVGLFGGVVDAGRASFPMSLIMKKLPQGNWRDWDAIRTWARDLAARLADGRSG